MVKGDNWRKWDHPNRYNPYVPCRDAYSCPALDREWELHSTVGRGKCVIPASEVLRPLFGSVKIAWWFEKQ